MDFIDAVSDAVSAAVSDASKLEFEEKGLNTAAGTAVQVAKSPIRHTGAPPAVKALTVGLPVSKSPLGQSALRGEAAAITGDQSGAGDNRPSASKARVSSGRKADKPAVVAKPSEAAKPSEVAKADKGADDDEPARSGRRVSKVATSEERDGERERVAKRLESESTGESTRKGESGSKARKIAGDAPAKRIARHYKNYFAKLEAAEAGKQAIAADQHSQLKLEEEAARAAGVLSAKKGDRAGQRIARHYKNYFAKLEAAEAGKQAVAADQHSQLKLEEDAAQGAGIIGSGNDAAHSGVTGGMIAAGTLATVCVAAIAALAYRARRVAMQSPLLAPAHHSYQSLA